MHGLTPALSLAEKNGPVRTPLPSILSTMSQALFPFHFQRPDLELENRNIGENPKFIRNQGVINFQVLNFSSFTHARPLPLLACL